jgi:hypothetical protein
MVRFAHLSSHRDSLDDESTFTLALDVERVSLSQEFDILLEELERDALFRGIDQDRTDLLYQSSPPT